MTIKHHLDDATVLAFAAGTLGEAHKIVAASHISLCTHCRDNLRSAEKLGGEALAIQQGEAVSDLCRSATFASLDAAITSVPKARATTSDLPPALWRALDGKALAELHWRRKAPGIAMVDIPVGRQTTLKLMRIASGNTLPEHGHGGDELTLVLKGSYRDHLGHFQVGDVADLGSDIEHQPKVDSVEDCICLVAIAAPTRFRGLLARLAQPFMGI